MSFFEYEENLNRALKTQIFYFNTKIFWSSTEDRGFKTNFEYRTVCDKENLKVMNRKKKNKYKQQELYSY